MKSFVSKCALAKVSIAFASEYEDQTLNHNLHYQAATSKHYKPEREKIIENVAWIDDKNEPGPFSNLKIAR